MVKEEKRKSGSYCHSFLPFTLFFVFSGVLRPLRAKKKRISNIENEKKRKGEKRETQVEFRQQIVNISERTSQPLAFSHQFLAFSLSDFEDVSYEFHKKDQHIKDKASSALSEKLWEYSF